MKMKFRTTTNFILGEFPGDVELPDPKSLTVPGMAFPMQDLLNRLVQGREVPLVRDPVYEGHLDVPDVRRMSRPEKEMYAKEVREKIRKHQSLLQQAKAESHANQVSQLEAKIAELEAARSAQIDAAQVQSEI